MNRNYSRIIEASVARQFSFLLGEAYEVVREYRDKNGLIQDIAILLDHSVVAFIECKTDAKRFISSGRFFSWFEIERASGEAKYLFLADDRICFYLKEDRSFTELSFSHAASIIREERDKAGKVPSFAEVKAVLNEAAGKADFFETLSPEDVEFDENSAKFYLSKEVEDGIFLKMLKKVDAPELCRYTSLDSLFELLKKEKQNICNVVCMNDRGEYRYADNYVFSHFPQVGTKDFEELDSCYVLSLLDRSRMDDLTMWRLYGDDANGACLLYNVDKTMRSGTHNKFFLARVSYAQKDGAHPELDFLKRLLDSAIIRGWRFSFQRWNIWKHFFKSYDFSVEKEIRLMYYDDSVKKDGGVEYKWIKNSCSQIVTKMLLFEFNDSFPLNVQASLIGPKREEADLLARQFQLMADSTATCRISVNCSKLKDYR